MTRLINTAIHSLEEGLSRGVLAGGVTYIIDDMVGILASHPQDLPDTICYCSFSVGGGDRDCPDNRD
jgi:hypothetical protein